MTTQNNAKNEKVETTVQTKLDIVENKPQVSEFVFMEKTAQVLEIGMMTNKNVILWDLEDTVNQK